MARNDHSNSGGAFDHNVAWTSRTVVERYDDRRFSSWSGRLYDQMEKRAIGRCLDRASAHAPIERVLDVPCGTGRISEFLVARGLIVTCGDVSEEMLRMAEQKLGKFDGAATEFMKMDIYDIGVEAASFDCVTCIRLFQHLTSEDRARALVELARVSRRYVIVNAMYTSVYYGAIRRIRKALGRYAPRYTMSKEEMLRETSTANLRIVETILPQPGYNGNLVMLLEKT